MKQDFNSKLDFLLKENRLDFKTSREEAKLSVMERIRQKGKVIPLKRSTSIYSKLALAASFAILFVLSISFFGSSTITNSGDDILVHTLPNGSTISMNPSAELVYNDLTWVMFRSLDFSGSGFFEVTEGSKFKVSTESGEVTVLGTSFSVITKSDKLRVSCKTGKVRVENNNNAVAVLTPGKGIEMNEFTSEEFSLETTHVDAWLYGVYRFDNVRIEQVFNSIEDFTDFEIIITEDINVSYSGEFSTDQSIDEILEIVCKPTQLTYEMIEEKSLIRITNK